MSVGKTNPLRQMMINMMYLVLTAMLALNVSAEILLAFKTVNDGMLKTIALIDNQEKAVMDNFEKLKETTKEAALYQAKAVEVNKACDELYAYVENLKHLIIEESGGMEWNAKENDSAYKNMKDLESVTRIMVNNKRGDALQEEIGKTREKLEEVAKSVDNIKKNWETFEPKIIIKKEEAMTPGKTWAAERFHMVPVIACVTLLTKIQSDVRTTQQNINTELLSQIGKLDFKFNTLIPVVRVTTGKSAVAVGEKYEAEILLAAYDSNQQPEIFLSGKPLEVKNGKATYVGSTASQGSFKFSGEIVVTNKSTGEKTKYPYELAYDVFNAPAIISPTKMNVIYMGLENPFSISVPGFRPTDVKASISSTAGGSITPVAGKPGDFIVVVPEPKGQFKLENAKINVTVNLPGGGIKNAGSGEFRLKKVPAPVPYLGSKSGGEISAAELRTINMVAARLENFAFDLTYRVTKFKMVYQPKRGNAQFADGNGAQLTNEMKGWMTAPGAGDMLIVTNIWAEAPGLGNKQIPGAVVLTVK
ncbi:MAG: gliding motility protein GldM [Sphingobacteriales bacterium]|nr:gliding motility protein GldM [Sphingobacteriales bacterium]